MKISQSLIIESRFKIFSAVNVGLIFILLLNFLLFYILYSDRNKSNFDYSALVFLVIIFLVFNGFFIIYYLVTNPRWTLTQTEIIIKHFDGTKFHIPIKEIIVINLYGLKKIPIFLNVPSTLDAIEIKTENRSFYIPIDNYSNTDTLRKELSKLYLGKHDNDFLISLNSHSSIDTLTNLNKWGVFVFYSFYLIAISIMFYFFYLILNNSFRYVFLTLSVLFTFSIGFCTFYLSYNDEYLVIKNSIYFWYNKRIKFSDILGVYYQSGYRAPLRIFITLKDFSKQSFIVESVGSNNIEKINQVFLHHGISTS